ncbi:MAG: DUF4221 domain-containing protein [Bacteroidales bacterium]|nr:DUF4221 domain-containing protein [Bacteroidales bacterium]
MKNLFFYFSILIIAACNKAEKNNEIYTLDSLIVVKKHEIPFNELNPLHIQHYNDSILYATFYPSNNCIQKINLKKNLITDTIYLKNFHIKFFHVFNKDSILLYAHLYSNNSLSYKLYLVNNKGHIIKQYNLLAATNIQPIQHLKYYYVDNLFWHDSKLYFTLRYANRSLFNIFDYKTEKIYSYKHLQYPYLTHNFFYPNGSIVYYSVNLSYVKNHKIAITFPYTSLVYIFDIQNRTFITKHIKSNFIDTILPCSQPCEQSTSGYYGKIYTLNDSLYYRHVQLDSSYNHTKIYIWLDSNFNYLGESIINNNDIYFWYFNSITPFNFVASNHQILTLLKANVKLKKTTINALQSQLNLIKQNTNAQELEFCKIVNKNLQEPVREEHILNYIKNYYNIKDKNFAMIILHEDGCYSCNKYIEEFLNLNKTFFSSRKSTPLYISYVQKVLPGKQNSNNSATNSIPNNTIYDTSSFYKKIHPFSNFNPRLILVKNNRIICDTIAMTNSLENLVFKLFDFYN